MSKNIIGAIFVLVTVLSFGATAFGQSSSFVYQGKLQDGGLAANGTYQFEFKLFDAASGGNQIGQTISNLPATVTNGIFAVNLDFGAGVYDGAARFLEIGVRMNGSNQPYTALNPRQQVASTPYAVKSLKANEATTANNSLNLGGVPANQYVLTTDPRMNDDRDPLPGSANYIQNSSFTQANSNFNISGEGAAKNFNTSEGYKINSTKVLTAPGQRNIFAGAGAGSSNILGNNNSFFGMEAGFTNSFGAGNSFFGSGAGEKSNGTNNTFLGLRAGQNNLTGTRNVFLGFEAGKNQQSGDDNILIGAEAGVTSGVTGNRNIVIGKRDYCTGCKNNISIGSIGVFGNSVQNTILIGTHIDVLESNRTVIGNQQTESTHLYGFVKVNQLPFSTIERRQVCWELQTGKLTACYPDSANPSEPSNGGNLELIRRLDKQTEQIKKQNEQIKAQQTQIDALKNIVCQSNPNAPVCRK